MNKERPNTVFGLIDKRREIAGKVEQAEAVLRELVSSLAAIEATILLFDPNADLGRPKKAGIAHAAYRGEMARFVLTALRTAREPMTTLELARSVMKGRGIEPDHRMTVVARKREDPCQRFGLVSHLWERHFSMNLCIAFFALVSASRCVA